MGVETVNKELRHEKEEHFEGFECDIASGKAHHDLNPTKNYIMGEYKFPAITKHMPPEDADRIIATYFHDCMHEMKYVKVSNNEFHSFMNNEGSPFTNNKRTDVADGANRYRGYADREGVDVVRNDELHRTVTYFNSSVRTVGLLRHDYYMGLLLYSNYPVRNFIRRTPCKQFHPLCTDCTKIAKEEVNGWITDPEPFKPTIDKTFFSFIEDTHYLCMGYTVDKYPSGDTCFEYLEPEYYILDMDVVYFREAEYSFRKYSDIIVKNRRDGGEMYSLGGTVKNSDEETLPHGSSSWEGPHTPLTVVKYNCRNRNTVPSDIWSAISHSDMIELWEADIIRFNARSSAHKFTFNSWWNPGVFSSDGWFCGFKSSELIGGSGAGFGAAGKAVEGQLTQVAHAFGMDEGVAGSTDSEFELIYPKYEGYTYSKIDEPLPIRDL